MEKFRKDDHSLSADYLHNTQDYFSRLLKERETRLSILSNSPKFSETKARPEGFIQEDLNQDHQRKKQPKKVIKINDDIAVDHEINLKDSSFYEKIDKKLSINSGDITGMREEIAIRLATGSDSSPTQPQR